MNRILVIGDLLTDRYRFLKPLRSDPANNVALVVENEREEIVDGGAGNLVRNLLCSIFSHGRLGRGLFTGRRQGRRNAHAAQDRAFRV